MKKFFFFLLLAGFSASCAAQQMVTMKKLWTKPEVHLVCGRYTIYFRIKDIDKALTFLPPAEQQYFGATCGLAPGTITVTELVPSTRMQYTDHLQPLLQKGVGAYLLASGHAAIEKKRHKKLTAVQVNIGPPMDFNSIRKVPVTIYDPKDGTLIFQGEMNADLYHKDLGFD